MRDADLEWLLTASDTEMGVTSTYNSMIGAALFGDRSGESPPPLTDRQLGWGRHHGRGTVARARRLRAAWKALPMMDRILLRAYYAPPVRMPRQATLVLGRLAAPALAMGLDGSKPREARRQVEQRLSEAHRRWKEMLP